MSKISPNTTQPPSRAPGSLASYTVGFVLSIVLTLVAYVLVANHVVAGHVLLLTILLLAAVQFGVQLLFFLHLGHEGRPRWNLVLLLFMLIVLVIVVYGSLWIMDNLNYNMTPHGANDYIINDERIPVPDGHHH